MATTPSTPPSRPRSGRSEPGSAGFAKGGADVTLIEDGDGTILDYAVKADVGGKLAQIGSRLVQSTANKYAADFFARFGDIVTGAVPIEEETAIAAAAVGGKQAIAAAHATAPADDKNTAHLRRLNWALLAIIVALMGFILLTD
jgi:hypothetical protein